MFPGEDITRLIPQNVRSILEDLKANPVEYLKWLYGKANDEIYQGDILSRLTVYSLDETGKIASREGPAIVISQTCDCQPTQSEFVLVAPLFALNDLAPDEEFTAEEVSQFRRDLSANRLKDKIYLPAIGKLPDSWLDLSQIFSIASEHFHSDAFKDSRERITALSQKGHYFFLMRLAFFLGRPDPIDSKRPA